MRKDSEVRDRKAGQVPLGAADTAVVDLPGASRTRPAEGPLGSGVLGGFGRATTDYADEALLLPVRWETSGCGHLWTDESDRDGERVAGRPRCRPGRPGRGTAAARRLLPGRIRLSVPHRPRNDGDRAPSRVQHLAAHRAEKQPAQSRSPP